MTVRWKPLMILSGLFVVVALMGVMAMAFVLAPRTDPMVLARKERATRNYKHAEIHFKQALQRNPRDVKALEELAGLYEEWAEVEPADQPRLRLARLACLTDAANHGKQAAGPRRALLREAILRDDPVEALSRAKQLIAIDPRNADANFILADEALDRNPPDLEDARRHLQVLAAETPRRPRTDGIEARIALLSGDKARLAEILDRTRSTPMADDVETLDGLALLWLRAEDACRVADPVELAARAQVVKDDAGRFTKGRELSPNRIARVGDDLARVHAALDHVAGADRDRKEEVQALGDGLDEVAESTFRDVLDAEGRAPDLRVYRAYAEHLLLRNKRDRCLEVVDQGLQAAPSTVPGLAEALMDLREIGVKAALADAKDPKRFERAEPFIRDLLGGEIARFRAIGHLFRGAIELEKSGLAGNDRRDQPARPDQDASRARALEELRIAADELPRVPAAQALYGVALILAQEPDLGRQRLQAARQLGSLEPRYQIWAAWSMVQAGYPEEAEPIVAGMLDAAERGEVPGELVATIHMLNGEVHQARRSPRDLELARAEYQKAGVEGREVSPTVELRLAQLDVLGGRPDEALARIARLEATGQGGASAEQLAVLTLTEQGKADEARRRLDAARSRYPRSGELAMLDAFYRARAGEVEPADKILAEFLRAEPNHLGAGQLRARILAESLKRTDEARALLADLSERTGNSAPLVQLALLDLERRDFDATARTIAQIRGHWKEAAAADLLDGQLALAKGDLRGASARFGEALKKDPENKVVLLAKAELDRRTGASAEATKLYEQIAREPSVKELDSGLSLATAARSALASQALEAGEFDLAIHRLEGLIQEPSAQGALARQARWQLIAARAAKGDWPAARKEIADLLKDPAATLDERVQAANYYRLHHEDAAAQAQLDWVLKQGPAHPGAVVIRSYMMTTAKPSRPAEAAALLRRAIAAGKESPAVFFVLLAAVENVTPPADDAPARALAALDRGLAMHPGAADLVQAKYRVVRLSKGREAAIQTVEEALRAHEGEPLRRLLAEIYREEDEFGKARGLLARMIEANPDDRQAATAMVQAIAAEAARAAGNGEADRARTLGEEEARWIRRFRDRFPDALEFLQADCELAIRQGDAGRAAAIVEEADSLDPGSPLGPLLRARLAAVQGHPREEQKALREALNRNPGQGEVRLQLARTCMGLGEPDAAIDQVDRVLEVEPDRPEAQVLKAEALAARGGPADRRADDLARAAELLDRAIRHRPSMTEAYQGLARVRRLQGRRAEAVAALKAGLEADGSDPAGLAMLVQLLAQPLDGDRPPTEADLKEADALADRFAGGDHDGSLCLAAAVGFHQAGQLDRARPWAEKAAGRLDAPAAHLAYGDLLLAMAEADADSTRAKATLERALIEYDRVLKARPESVEAINNKAWILHRYFDRNREALDLASGLVRQVDSAALPGEFFDTLGAVQEALGKVDDAEQSYAQGLRKSPEQPVLNYHMGRLLAGNPDRSGKARGYLEKALAAADRLPPTAAAEAESLLKKIDRR